jgi:hypothetical protein
MFEELLALPELCLWIVIITRLLSETGYTKENA